LHYIRPELHLSTYSFNFFRFSSGNGVIDIGANFNGDLVSAEEVKVYLAKWKEFMLLIMN
jgi:hypothetical protein